MPVYVFESLIMLIFGYLGLGFPDIDQLMLPWLHHRSILTHSIFAPLLVISLRREVLVHLGVAGFLLGLAVHLSADVLSPPVGYGMVWLPWPVKTALGPLSPLWLAGNALVGLVWAKLLLAHLKAALPKLAFAGMAVGFGVTYAVFHEHSLLAFISFASLFIAGLAIADWMIRQGWLNRLMPMTGGRPDIRRR